MSIESPEQEKVFDPEEEFEQLKSLPHSERRGAIGEFKEKKMAQMEGLATMQAEISDAILENPNIPRERLDEMVQEFARKYGFSERQLGVAERILDRYEERHATVARIKGEHSSDEELYQAVFEEKPHGKIEVVESPVSLYFRCESRRDYMDAFGKLGGGAKPSLLKRIKGLFGTQGGASGAGVAGITNVVLVENSSMMESDPEQVREHEEQHAINHLFHEGFADDEYSRKLLEAREPHEKLNLIQDYYRAAIEENLKDEIIAFLESGTFKWDVMREVKDGYIALAYRPLKPGFEDDLNKLEKNLQEQGLSSDALKEELGRYREAFDKAFDIFNNKDYKRRLFEYLCDNIKAYESLSKGIGNEKGFALAINAPMSDWRALSRRMRKEDDAAANSDNRERE